MRTQSLQEKIHRITGKIVFVLASSFVLFACSKGVEAPIQNGSENPVEAINNFRLSESRLTLLQGNEANQAICFKWDAAVNKDAKYSIEAAVSGSYFAEPLEIASTPEPSISLKVKEFNSSMCQLLYGNTTGRVDFRVKAETFSHSGRSVTYSSVVALDVTTYQNFIEYDENYIIKIPGNYQGWNISTAPKIISADKSGEYEGYINFTNQYPQLLMVKGNDWETYNTYTYIGVDKFGFGGSVMSVFGGSGVYLFKANTNTNKWSYTKIDNWSIAGNAVPGNTGKDPVMVAGGESALCWSITTNMVKGNFRIRANNSNTISFGHKNCDAVGTPSYDGSDLTIKTPGNYTIRLELRSAGNYAYSILKNN